jgi:hypothetical protein
MENVSRKNLKVFGWGLVLILCFLGTRSWLEHGMNGFALFCAVFMIFFSGLTAFDRPLLKTIYHYWMKAAGVISKVITTIILTFLYYFLFTPIGFLLKCGKNQLIEKNINKEASTYWTPLEQQEFNKDNYHKQY